MKWIIYILVCCTVAFYGCSSQKKLETSTPFVLGNASCQKWTGGREDKDPGEIVKITVRELTGMDVSFLNIYFRGSMAPVVMEMDDQGMMATAKFETRKPDIIMHADSLREVGNQPPKRATRDGTEFPFDLRETEAVLSYMENEKVKYVKVVGIADKQVTPQN
ncbi:MAG TPA: hypothetical protein VKN36_06935 [Eudoraea sp.]|nr:hypothetical protein [Eudoraea sp.]